MASTEAGMVGAGFEISVSASPKPSLLSLGQVRSRVYQVSPMTRGSIVAPAQRMPISSTRSSQADDFDFRGILTFFGAGHMAAVVYYSCMVPGVTHDQLAADRLQKHNKIRTRTAV